MTIVRKDSELGQAVELARNLKRSYTDVFRSPVGQVVLKDLAQFCYATESTFHTDPRIDAYQQGMKAVWENIQRRLNLTAEEIYSLARGGRISQES